MDAVEVLGADTFVYGATPGSGPSERQVVARLQGRVRPTLESVLWLDFSWEKAHLFDAESGQRIDFQLAGTGA